MITSTFTVIGIGTTVLVSLKFVVKTIENVQHNRAIKARCAELEKEEEIRRRTPHFVLPRTETPEERKKRFEEILSQTGELF